jgi:hypothetical protein
MLIDETNLEFVHPHLRVIVLEINIEFGMQAITSLYRIGDNGVHGTLPLRAIDVRCRNDDMGKVIEKWVNARYMYDPARPKMKVAMYHDVGRGKHLHLQVHDHTVEK